MAERDCMKAKKLNVFRDKYFTQIEYEYRGCTYEVEYANGINVCCTPAYIQHKEAQAEIDKMLDNPEPQKQSKSEPVDFAEILAMLEMEV